MTSYQQEYYLKNKDRIKTKCAQYYQDNQEKCLDYAKAYRELNKEKLKESQKKYKAKDPLKHRIAKYKLTTEQYTEMLLDQDNQCKVCLEHFVKTPCVDHCHTTGRIRGLLCNLCNVGLGAFLDSPKRLKQATQYLRRYIDGEKDNA